MKNIRTFGRMFCQLMSILNKKQRLQIVGIALMSIVTAFMETLGISVVIPFIISMLQPEMLMENVYVKGIIKLLHLPENINIVLFTGLGIVIIYLLKNMFILYVNFIQAKFRNGLEKDLSVLMLKAYMNKPYFYHVNTNSSQIMRGITGDAAGVAAVVDSYSSLINEILTCILIAVVLVLLNPIMAIGILAIAGVTAVIMVVSLRKKIACYGENSREAFAERYKDAYQAISGIKEIDVYRKQDTFAAKFEKSSTTACNYNTKYLCISKMPSRIIEVVFIGSLVLLVYICLGQLDNKSTMIAQFGALAVAAIRVLPAISNITNAMNALVFNRLALESACINISSAYKESENTKTLKCNEMIEQEREAQSKELSIDKICWKYTENQENIISNLSLSIKEGESVAIIGESGAGKTTFIDILLGLFQPQKGNITMNGKSIFENPDEWAKTIGYVPQTVFLLDDTIRNNIAFGILGEQIQEDAVWNAIEQAQLLKFVESQSKGLDEILGERGVKISGGQRQRIAIARALYHNPDILVLDEATSALDTETEQAVMESIDALKGKKTLIIVAHRLSTIKKCDTIYEIQNGQAKKRDKEEIFGE